MRTSPHRRAWKLGITAPLFLKGHGLRSQLPAALKVICRRVLLVCSTNVIRTAGCGKPMCLSMTLLVWYGQIF